MPIISEETIKGQDWFLKLSELLGYKLEQNGACHGVANLALDSYFNHSLNTFKQRVYDLHEIAGFKESEIKAIKNAILNEKKPYNKQISLNNSTIKRFDIFTFFDSIDLYQRPRNYPDFFNKKNGLLQTLNPARPLLFRKNNQPIEAASFPCAYNLPELVCFLKLYQTTFNIPFSFLLGSGNHTINLNFDVNKKKMDFN